MILKIPELFQKKRSSMLQVAIVEHRIILQMQQQNSLRSQLAELTEKLEKSRAEVAGVMEAGAHIKDLWDAAVGSIGAKSVEEAKVLMRSAKEEFELDAIEYEEDRIHFLENKVAELEGLLDAAHATDQGIVDEYETRANEIEKLDVEVKEERKIIQQLLAETKEIQDLWEPNLISLIASVSSQFSSYFSRIRCAGEVLLRKSGRFSEYGLDIMVKFRAAHELQKLDKSRQSGGVRT
jgi:chromosome segregation ATPase